MGAVRKRKSSSRILEASCPAFRYQTKGVDGQYIRISELTHEEAIRQVCRMYDFIEAMWDRLSLANDEMENMP
jgi:hypothetical protein